LINLSHELEKKEILNVLNKNKKKNSILKPVKSSTSDASTETSKSKIDPLKRLMGCMPKATNSEAINDEKQMRKTFTKIEKIEIDCESLNTTSNNLMSKSMINFEEAYNEEEIKSSENKFNILVRNQINFEYHQVYDFLDALELEKHLDKLIQNGVDDLDKLKTRTYKLINISG
jgi:hypothetical protein